MAALQQPQAGGQQNPNAPNQNAGMMPSQFLAAMMNSQHGGTGGMQGNGGGSGNFGGIPPGLLNAILGMQQQQHPGLGMGGAMSQPPMPNAGGMLNTMPMRHGRF